MARHYVHGTLVPFEEDATHEFKGHRNLSVEEIPPWCWIPHTDRRSRKAASRAINAFLNSENGGTVYLGVIDEGVVKGLHLTNYQKDHVVVGLKDLLQRYTPIVPEDMVKLEFVPVIKAGEKLPDQTSSSKRSSDELANHLRAHLLRTYDFCWCDKDAAVQLDAGNIPQDYIIEISVLPSRAGFEIKADNQFRLNLPPVYQNEEGLCFFRRSASCVQYSAQEIYDLTVQQVRDHYQPVIESLRREIKLAREQSKRK